MTKEVFNQLVEATVKQCPGRSMFQDGTKWTAYVESETWRKKGVDDEIIADSKTLKCSYMIIDRKWTMTHINGVEVEECIED